MYRIIEGRGTGKTSNLMLTAKLNNAKFVCKNPYAMKQKAEAYGIIGIDFIGYNELFQLDQLEGNIVVDELEEFVAYLTNHRLVGYTLTNED